MRAYDTPPCLYQGAALKQPHHTPTNLLHHPPPPYDIVHDDCNAAIVAYYLRCCMLHATCHMLQYW